VIGDLALWERSTVVQMMSMLEKNLNTVLVLLPVLVMVPVLVLVLVPVLVLTRYWVKKTQKSYY
jgi:hypothetical protein